MREGCHMTVDFVPEQAIRRFYDGYDRRLLNDYAYGNPRTERAIQFALSWIAPNATRILDVGCGIGWSSWEIHRHFPNATVIGLDLSHRLIELASLLFPCDDLDFIVNDVNDLIDDSRTVSCSVDTVVLLDVYEHIPVNMRPRLHSLLDRVLKHDGNVVLTFPSLRKQEFLRKHDPCGLQPIDEDVDLRAIQTLARDVCGRVSVFDEISVWANGDYNHAIVSRGLNVVAPSTTVRMEDANVRRTRVQKALKRRVLPGGILPSMGGNHSVCIVTPSLGSYSETFIRSHIEHLPADVHVLSEGRIPLFGDGEALLKDYNLPQRIRFRLHQQRHGLPWDGQAKHRAAIIEFLYKNQTQVVLAEYGLSGVAMMEICERAGIPLVVHFHGYDAYKTSLLRENAHAYSALFQKAAAIIAVSQDMIRQLSELGAPKHKLHYNPYGVDLSLFSVTDPSIAPPCFVAVGRFVDKKAPLLTLLAFRQVVNAVPDARLVMIGDGTLLEASRQLAQAMRLTPAVDFRGVQLHYEVAAAMQQARAFVQHSLHAGDGDSEGTPVAILEASACGLPVVSTRHAGIPDVVVDGETGLLVDELDVDGMAQAMIRLAQDPALAARMGQAGRRRVEGHFSMERSIANLWHIIESAIESRDNATR